MEATRNTLLILHSSIIANGITTNKPISKTQMKIKINTDSSNELHRILEERFKTKSLSNGFEKTSHFPQKTKNLVLKSYSFSNRIDFHIFKGDILSLIEIEYSGKSNCVRYLFIKQGELILNLSNIIRTRLSSHYSAIVALSETQNQIFTLPIQNNFELFFVEINSARFSTNKQADIEGLPKELIELFSSNPGENHFLYQSYYTLSITDSYNEIISSKAEGISKRFFLESKVFELLWLQTEQYKNELLYGYDANALRKFDVELIKKAKDFIHNNCEKELTLNLISRAIGTNETKLKTGLKKMYGKTFSEILLNERLHLAKLLIEENKLSVKEVAHSCGYKSASMFSVRFKERFGILPSQYKLS